MPPETEAPENPVVTTTTTPPEETRLFTAEQVAKIRQDEKDKLYSELTALKNEMSKNAKVIADLQEVREKEMAEVLRKEQEKESKLKAKKEEEMSAKALLEAKLRETNDTWEERFNALQTEREQERAVLAKERAYNELVDYRNNRLMESADSIAPQLHPFIGGDTREQIDAAIAQAVEATNSIAAEVEQVRREQTPQVRGVSPTGYGPIGPVDNALTTKTYSAADINNMSMQEYAKFREEYGLSSNEARRNRGILG